MRRCDQLLRRRLAWFLSRPCRPRHIERAERSAADPIDRSRTGHEVTVPPRVCSALRRHRCPLTPGREFHVTRHALTRFAVTTGAGAPSERRRDLARPSADRATCLSHGEDPELPPPSSRRGHHHHVALLASGIASGSALPRTVHPEAPLCLPMTRPTTDG